MGQKAYSPQTQVVWLTAGSLADSVSYGCVLNGIKIMKLLEGRGTSHYDSDFIYSFSSKTFIKWLLCENESHLIICGFCICRFVCSLKFICNFRINTVVSCYSWACVYIEQWITRAVVTSTHTFPAEVEWCHTLPYFFSSHTVNKTHFCGIFSVTFYSFLCFLLLTLLLKWLPSVVCKCCLGCDVPFYGENACIR